METKYKILRIILLFITLLVVNGDLLAQSAQTINPNGGASASLDDGLKVVVNINGTLSVYRQNQTQYFSGYVWPDGAGNGVTLNFRFDNGTTYNSTSLTMTACSTTAAQQVGNDWTTSISGYVTSPISSKKFFVTMNFKYTHPNRYFLVDYIVRAPFDLPAPETVHLYLSHDAYILGSDGSRGYITQNTSGHFVGDYRDASDSNTTCSGSKKNPVFPSTHGFKTSGTGFRSYYSGPYSPRNTIDASTLKLTNTLGTTCIDDGIAVEFTIGPLAAGQVGTKGVIHAYGNTKGEFDNTPVSDPVPPTNISTPVSVNFVSATISEPEGNVSHPANNIQIVAGGGRLYQEQVCNFSVVSGGTAVQGTDFTYVKGFIIPAGDYSTPKTLTLDNFTILGNTTCQNNRTIRIQIDSEVCNDLVQRGTTILTTYTIADDDIPTVSQPSNKVFCNKETVAANTFVFTGSTLPNTTYTWTNSNTAIGLAASGTGNIPAFTATNTGTAPLIATITVTPNQGSCVGDPKQFTITVNPTATIGTVLNNLTYCGGSSSPAITLTSATTGTTYAWTNSNTAIGLAVSGTGNIPAFTATNATANPITATIRVTPTANGCVGTYKEYTITVNPTPTVSTVLNNLTYCNASSSPAITLASATTGTTYTWTNTNTAIGLAASGTGNIPAFTATNATANPITATIRVTPTANGCVGTYKEYTITVNPTPTVSTVLNNLTYCNSSSSPAITLASATTGTTYAWTNTNAAIGLAASGSGNIPTFTATNTTANPITATIRVTPTANGCTGIYKEYTITVNPTPTVSTVLNNLTYCNASSSPAITLASATTGTTYTWTNTNTSIGLAASGTGNIPAFTATNATANPITATIRVTPTANGCVGTYKEYTITVNPTPTVSTVLNNLTYCNSSSSPAITLASATTGTTYAWTNTNAAIGLAASGTGNIPAFTATNTTANPITATIRVTPTANGCVGTYKEYTITVRPVVVVGTITGNPYACEGDVPQIIKGIATIGGTGTFTYQWQQSINNTTWTNISGATGLDYTPGVLTQSTYFKRISIDANCGSFESNSFLITKVAAGVKFTWKSTAIDNNWNNPANWTNTGGLVDAVPTKCSDVHIPSVSNKYPSLDAHTDRTIYGDPVTDKIVFHFGSELSYPHKLTYNKAFIQYNWGYYAGGSNEQPGSNAEGPASKMITRDRWYMLAAPLKKMASGDFALGGYPITWQSLYNAPHPSTGALVEGDFSTPFSSNDIDLSTKNNALAVKVACYNSNIGYNDQRHLEGLQGILEIPYFENSTMADYHPGHVYNKIRKESRFYYFDEKTLQQLSSPIGTLSRGDEAYRFVFEDENTNKAPNIVVNGVTVPGYTHRVTSGTSNNKTVMIGNPFMATINSRLFFEANRTKLKEDAGYYMLTPTNQVWSRYEYKTENKVPALQAIVITLAEGLTSADLVYPLEGTYALTEVSNQTRSVTSLSDDSGNSLYIRATDSRNKTSDYAILKAEETTASSGISKMIYPSSHSVTEAFIVSSDQEYNLIDFYNEKRTEVGLGIKSSNQKDVLTLEFENVESFKSATGFSPVLIDKYLNIEQDLSSNNVYRFNQRKTESERQYSDVNRFSLRLSSATSGIIDEPNSEDLIRVTYLTSQLEVSSEQGLNQIDVYDLQGRHMHTSGKLTGAPISYSKYLPLNQGVYIVKVKTSLGNTVAKKINAK